jgi:hypothetical protein
MKKLFFIVFLVLSFSFLNGFNVSVICKSDCAIESLEMPGDIEYVEYVLIGEQWFIITHYTDGTIGIEPSSTPPRD